MEKGYPEPSSHGVLPVHGLLVCHARGIVVDNVKIETMKPDARPALLLVDTEDVRLRNVELDGPASGPSVVLRKAINTELNNVGNLKDRNIKDVEKKDL